MLYLELLHEVTGNLSGDVWPPGIYSKVDEYGPGDMVPGQLGYSSNRIWRENGDGTVSYIKLRNSDPYLAKVDMVEFVFIKLKAIAI